MRGAGTSLGVMRLPRRCLMADCFMWMTTFSSTEPSSSQSKLQSLPTEGQLCSGSRGTGLENKNGLFSFFLIFI